MQPTVDCSAMATGSVPNKLRPSVRAAVVGEGNFLGRQGLDGRFYHGHGPIGSEPLAGLTTGVFHLSNQIILDLSRTTLNANNLSLDLSPLLLFSTYPAFPDQSRQNGRGAARTYQPPTWALLPLPYVCGQTPHPARCNTPRCSLSHPPRRILTDIVVGRSRLRG